MAQHSTVLITGASSGIGLALAHEFAKHGHHVVLVSRSRDALEALAKELREQCRIIATPIVKDLSQAYAAQELFDDLRDAGLTIDMLVNNAGIGVYGNVADNDPKRLHDLLAINIVALTELARLFLPGMLERKSGRVLNIGSLAGYAPGPGFAVYYASKAYVHSLSEALWQETRGTGVTVTCLCPGETRTNFFRAAGVEENIEHFMDPAIVARIGYAATMRGARTVNAGWRNSMFAWWMRYLPHALLLRVIHKWHR